MHLTARIGVLLLFGLADPLDHTAFQTVFGMILTVLIAVEFVKANAERESWDEAQASTSGSVQPSDRLRRIIEVQTGKPWHG